MIEVYQQKSIDQNLLLEKKMAESLRSKEHEVLGFPSPLPKNVLPSKGDVLKRLVQSKESLQIELDKKNVPISKIVQPVISELIMIWDKASIPTMQYRSIDKALTTLWQNATRNVAKNDYVSTEFSAEKNALFDICSCKCKSISCHDAVCCLEECEGFHLDCNCDKLKKVPKRELSFLLDQRKDRKMVISGVDQTVTGVLKRAEKRKSVLETQKNNEKQRLELEQETQMQANADFFATEDEENVKATKHTVIDPDFEVSHSKRTRSHSRNMHELPKTAAACDRRNVSSEAAADIINSWALDMGILTEENKHSVTVDKSKLNRWRKKERAATSSLKEKEIASNPGTGFYFDGKKDATLTQQLKGEKRYTKTIIEDHYVMLEEPDSQFLGHEVPLSGHGISVGLMSYRFLKSKGWDATLSVVGADGCRVNTGHNEGAIVYLEKLLGRPLHWFICLLHGVELPFRAIVRELDGGTKGPFSLKGPIGKTLGQELNELPIVPFKKVPNPDFPVVAEGDYELSKDQQYLLSMSHAVMEGHVPEDLANQAPGPLSMARWITLASRFLRKYVSTPNPSKTFDEIIDSLMLFYGPSWFFIKTHPTCVDGPRNFFYMVKNSRKLGLRVQKIIQKTLQRNAYFAHPEAILLSMLEDSNQDVRAQAVNTILTIRMKANHSSQEIDDDALALDDRGVDEIDDDNEYSSDDDELPVRLEPEESAAIGSATIRKYRVPKVNFQAETYVNLIDWEAEILSEPPLTRNKTEAEILSFKEAPFAVPKYPCHTQAVERAVRLVSEASAAVVGKDARNGFIRQRIEARKELPRFKTKQEFFKKIQ